MQTFTDLQHSYSTYRHIFKAIWKYIHVLASDAKAYITSSVLIAQPITVHKRITLLLLCCYTIPLKATPLRSFQDTGVLEDTSQWMRTMLCTYSHLRSAASKFSGHSQQTYQSQRDFHPSTQAHKTSWYQNQFRILLIAFNATTTYAISTVVKTRGTLTFC